MNLKSIIKSLVKEAIYVQKPKYEPKFRDDDPLGGYMTKKVDFPHEDPDTVRGAWEVRQEPQISRFAKEVKRMKLELKYFEHLPDDDPHYKSLKDQARSIVASLGNAEGKLRQLYQDIQITKKFKK